MCVFIRLNESPPGYSATGLGLKTYRTVGLRARLALRFPTVFLLKRRHAPQEESRSFLCADEHTFSFSGISGRAEGELHRSSEQMTKVTRLIHKPSFSFFPNPPSTKSAYVMKHGLSKHLPLGNLFSSPLSSLFVDLFFSLFIGTPSEYFVYVSYDCVIRFLL